MDVDFDQLTTQMEDRKQEIIKTRQGLFDLMVAHDDGSLRVDPDHKAEARQIQAKINELKDKNKISLKFYNYALKKVKEHNIPLVRRGGAAVGTAELLEQISEVQNKSYYATRDLKIKFLEKQINSADYEKELQEVKEQSNTRITELTSINNSLEKEYEKLMKR